MPLNDGGLDLRLQLAGIEEVVAQIVAARIFSPGAPWGPLPLPTILNLPGVSRQGGFGTPDAASHNARASKLNAFMFGSGPNRRYVGDFASAPPAMLPRSS